MNRNQNILLDRLTSRLGQYIDRHMNDTNLQTDRLTNSRSTNIYIDENTYR